MRSTDFVCIWMQKTSSQSTPVSLLSRDRTHSRRFEVAATGAVTSQAPGQVVESLAAAEPTRSNSPDKLPRRTQSKSAIDTFAQSFMALADVKTRSYNMTTYPNCFVGNQIVQALINKGVVPDATLAVSLGHSLL